MIVIDRTSNWATPKRILALLIATLTHTGCVAKPNNVDTCSGYPDSNSSPYVLPFSPGESYRVSQGNCSPPGNGHRDSEKYAYDFDMPIGTPFVAVRSGVVLHVEESHQDGQVASKGFDNYIIIRHDDGTHALYAHLTHNGSDVGVGNRIALGQRIGKSGNTGNTNNYPHLHLAMHICDPVANGSEDCPTWPITFKNAGPNPNGLQRGQIYEAKDY